MVNLRRDLAAGGIFFLYGSLRLLPRSVAVLLCRALGRAAWVLDRSGRSVTLSNLEGAFGEEMGPVRRKAVGSATYVNLAANLADLSRLTRLSSEELCSLVAADEESFGRLEDAVSLGRGVILLTPHLGNWELLAAYLANSGLKVHFVGREPYDWRLDSLFKAVRTSHGALWMSRGGAFEKLREVLGRGDLTILLIDQDTGRVKGTFVEFFGEQAWTPTGPAALARLTGSAMIPCALVRQPDNTYRLIIETSLRTVKTGDEEYDDWENTRRASLAIESLVAGYPEQWTWFHRRWRTRPPDDWVMPGPPRTAARLESPSPVDGKP